MNTFMSKAVTRSWGDRRIPRDVTEWVGSLSLVGLVLEAIEESRLPISNGAFTLNETKYRPQMLLTLITCAYAKGILGSQELEGELGRDKALKYICAGSRPDWNVIRTFRRLNQKAILTCLSQVLEKVWETRFPAKQPGQEGAAAYAADSLDRWLRPDRSPDFAAEAGRRLGMAIMADTMMMDE